MLPTTKNEAELWPWTNLCPGGDSLLVLKMALGVAAVSLPVSMDPVEKDGYYLSHGYYVPLKYFLTTPNRVTSLDRRDLRRWRDGVTQHRDRQSLAALAWEPRILQTLTMPVCLN